MNYPVWQLDFAGGGLLIALMAIIHVFISHFAIGGGLFLVMTEMKGYRENSPAILDYTRRHTRFFLLVTMVLGAMTGVGIWFTIGLLNPAAVSTLIHTYVFAWATEWVFFLAEIVAIFVYYYTFGKMERRAHLTVGWLYFLFAWLSLFVINGIISFMLTPGDWLTTGDFWDGFFNPTFWPSLFFRTFIALMLAGLYGFVTAVSLKDDNFRETMVRYCALWLLAPFYFLLASAWWYAHALPEVTRELILQGMPELLPFFKAFLWLSAALFTGGLVMAIRLPARVKRPLAWLLLLIGLLYMGSFEFIREGGRRPYVIHGHTYANAILKQDVETVRQDGVLAKARWVENRRITGENRLTAGRELYDLLCLACHAIGGPMNDIKRLTASYTLAGLQLRIPGLDILAAYMPPFPGTMMEARALAAFIREDLHGDQASFPPSLTVPQQPKPAPFDMENSGYVLLAWTERGMHTLTDTDAQWSFRPPGSNLRALLVKRGPTPELVTEEVTLTYMVEPSHTKPARQVDFWRYTEPLVGKKLSDNHGISGNKAIGIMEPAPDEPWFVANELPVVPYTDTGLYAPYPLVTVTALSITGRHLATSRRVLPVSTEIGCRNCHGGSWRVGNVAGISAETGMNVLEAHDRRSGTDLTSQAAAGQPLFCQDCHDDKNTDPAAPLNLSAAVHAFHAQFLTSMGAEVCSACHANSPEGATQFFRGIHKEIGLDCTSCHGPLADHALSLLQAEKQNGKERALALMEKITPQLMESTEEIVPRLPWQQEPDCLNCHEEFQPPDNDTTFNQWTKDTDDLFGHRTDEVGIPCAACHGAPHAIYPTTNPYEENLDNLIPLQYQGTPYPLAANRECRVCHQEDMEEEMHHPNSLRMFRNLR